MRSRKTAVNGSGIDFDRYFESASLSDVLIRFGLKMRAIRERKGVSQEKLAEMAGLHRTYVSSVERGERNISLLNIERLAVALGVPLAKLMP
jgi:predicted transcriptional regulator